MLKKLTLGGLALAMGLSLTACNDEQVAFGAGVVGGAIVATAVYDNHNRRDYRHSRGYERGYYYRDRHDGRWYRDRRGRWNRAYRWGRHNFEGAADAASSDGSIARKYVISRGAARLVIQTFEQVKRYGKFDSFQT